MLKVLKMPWTWHKDRDVRVNRAIALYTELEKWYERFLLTDLCQKWITIFDEVLPRYSGFTPTKKVDCILWMQGGAMKGEKKK